MYFHRRALNFELRPDRHGRMIFILFILIFQGHALVLKIYVLSFTCKIRIYDISCLSSVLINYTFVIV